jgi:formylglycine-generating enzyme required for sulfatase activity
MGSNSGDDDERPAYTVVLRQGFWLSRYQVTNEDYRRSSERKVWGCEFATALGQQKVQSAQAAGGGCDVA